MISLYFFMSFVLITALILFAIFIIYPLTQAKKKK
jgi:hypothetical protein